MGIYLNPSNIGFKEILSADISVYLAFVDALNYYTVFKETSAGNGIADLMII